MIYCSKQVDARPSRCTRRRENRDSHNLMQKRILQLGACHRNIIDRRCTANEYCAVWIDPSSPSDHRALMVIQHVHSVCSGENNASVYEEILEPRSRPMTQFSPPVVIVRRERIGSTSKPSQRCAVVSSRHFSARLRTGVGASHAALPRPIHRVGVRPMIGCRFEPV